MAGHCATALWIDGQLYILESQYGLYWRTKGIQKTRYSEWIKRAEFSDYHVIWLPLSSESREKFNEASTKKWFNKHEGKTYGFHNFFYGWLDTPADNLPQVVPEHIFPIFLAFLENFIPKSVKIGFTQPMNKRLETDCETVTCIAEEASKRGVSI